MTLIVDEMARAVSARENCEHCTDEGPCAACIADARAAAAVVAKRIRDELGGRVTDAGLWEYLEQLAAELEGA